MGKDKVSETHIKFIYMRLYYKRVFFISFRK